VCLRYRYKLLASFLAGLLLPLAYSPFDLFWLAPLCYAVLFYSWSGLSPSRTFWCGFSFGCASFFSGIHWVYVSIHDFGQLHFFAAAGLTLALVMVLACYVALAGWAAARWFPNDGPRAWLVVFPAVWVLVEWFRGWFLSGFGWLSVGYSQTDSWLMGFAPVGGVYLISWTVLFTAGSILCMATCASRMRIVIAFCLAMLWASGLVLSKLSWGEPTGRLLTVSLVQGAVPQDLKWQPQQFAPTLELYQRLTEDSAGSRLILWPEAAIPALYHTVEGFLKDVHDRAAELGSTVALGILRDDPGGGTLQNALVVLGEDPRFYIKRHLVPYGEVFPVPSFIRRWLRLMNLPYTDVVAGDPKQPALEIAGETVAITICYEDLFGAEQLHYFPEASLIVNVSNDAWFGDTIAPHQHLQVARMRSAEVSRYTLRAANTGISGVIDPRGRVVARSPQFEPHVLKTAVQGYTGQTPYVLWGNYLVVISALALLFAQFLVTKFTIRPGT
jgi:apolipoprotein N-acyltransferase